MNDKVKFYFEKIKKAYSDIHPKRRKQIGIVLLLIIVASVGVAGFLNIKKYDTLFVGLNEQEAREIIGKLQDKGVAYRYENDGTILVDSKEEERIKAELVYEGYPKSGFTYDIFKENINLMTTDFEKNSYKLFELQDRIGATIRLFDGVKDAKVTIALGEERRYVLDANQKTPASASVVVVMQNGGSPSPEQVKGIQRLVSKSIPQLDLSNVVVLDGDGNDVSQSDSLQSELAKLRKEFETQIENSVKSKIINVLAPFYGEENIRVSVKATVDMNKKIRETINYTLPELATKEEKQPTVVLDANGEIIDELPATETDENTNEVIRGIPSRESINQEITRDRNQAGGVVGTESNADIPIYGAGLPINGNELHVINQNDIDYLVNQIKEQTQVDSGMVEDMMISVSLNNKGTPGLSREDLLGLIGNAAGIEKDKQESKITVVSGAFYAPEEPPAEEVPPTLLDQYRIWIYGAVAAFILAFIVTLIVFMILRKRKKKKRQKLAIGSANHMEVIEEKIALEPELISIKNEKTLELRNNIRDFAVDNPEISAQLIRSWLRGEGLDD